MFADTFRVGMERGRQKNGRLPISLGRGHCHHFFCFPRPFFPPDWLGLLLHRLLVPTRSRSRPPVVFQRGLFQARQLLHRSCAWGQVWLQAIPGPAPPWELHGVDPPTR